MGFLPQGGSDAKWLLDAVHFDPSSLYSGTAYPVGSPSAPVNNEADLATILGNLGIHDIVVHNSFSLSQDWAGFNFMGIGEGNYQPIQINLNGKNVGGSTFRGLYLTGAQGGEHSITCYHCTMSSVTAFMGECYDCPIINVAFRHIGDQCKFYRCAGMWCNLDFALQPSRVDLFGCVGNWSLQNITDAGFYSSFDFASGQVYIESTCTQGRILIFGTCEINDDSAGTAVIDMREGVSRTSRCFQETAPAKDANGLGWVTILDRTSTIRPTRIRGIRVTVAGDWAGKARIRIVDGAGTPNLLFPFQGYYEQDTDFTSGTQLTFNFPVEIAPYKSGYQLQFCSTDGGDGPGKTLELNSLDVEEMR